MFLMGGGVLHHRGSFSLDDGYPCIVVYFGIYSRPNDTASIPTGLLSTQCLLCILGLLDCGLLVVDGAICWIDVLGITRPWRHI